MEVFLGLVTVILLYVTWETIKLKRKEKENDRKSKQRKTGPSRKGNRKANRGNSKAKDSK